jgi:hypothetical protein
MSNYTSLREHNGGGGAESHIMGKENKKSIRCIEVIVLKE